jgi:hypothetical protein
VRVRIFFEFHAISQMPHRIAEFVVVAQKHAHANGSCATPADFAARDDALFVGGGALLANVFARESTPRRVAI